MWVSGENLVTPDNSDIETQKSASCSSCSSNSIFENSSSSSPSLLLSSSVHYSPRQKAPSFLSFFLPSFLVFPSVSLSPQFVPPASPRCRATVNSSSLMFIYRLAGINTVFGRLSAGSSVISVWNERTKIEQTFSMKPLVSGVLFSVFLSRRVQASAAIFTTNGESRS